MRKTLSPCGIECNTCPKYPKVCGGCRTIEGKPWWLGYTEFSQCAVYECCHAQNRKTCAGCEHLPCERFTKDPSVSDEENSAHLRVMLENLSQETGTER